MKAREIHALTTPASLPLLVLATLVACSESPTDIVPGEAQIPWDLLSGRLVVGADEGGDAYLLDASTRSVTVIARGISGNAFALHPDGQSVAFAQVNIDGGMWDIRSIPLDQGPADCASGSRCGEPLVITDEWEWGPAWSPEGRLAYVATRETSPLRFHTGIYVEGQLIHPDTLFGDGYTGPAWDPTGSLVVQLRTRSSRNLYRIEVDSRIASVLIPDTNAWGDVAVSPDGGRLAYSEGLEEIWVADIDGGNARAIAEGEQVFAWSPDGNRVLYSVREREGGRVRHSLYLASVEGGSPTLLLPYANEADWR